MKRKKCSTLLLFKPWTLNHASSQGILLSCKRSEEVVGRTQDCRSCHSPNLTIPVIIVIQWPQENRTAGALWKTHSLFPQCGSTGVVDSFHSKSGQVFWSSSETVPSPSLDRNSKILWPWSPVTQAYSILAVPNYTPSPRGKCGVFLHPFSPGLGISKILWPWGSSIYQSCRGHSPSFSHPHTQHVFWLEI